MIFVVSSIAGMFMNKNIMNSVSKDDWASDLAIIARSHVLTNVSSHWLVLENCNSAKKFLEWDYVHKTYNTMFTSLDIYI